MNNTEQARTYQIADFPNGSLLHSHSWPTGSTRWRSGRASRCGRHCLSCADSTTRYTHRRRRCGARHEQREANESRRARCRERPGRRELLVEPTTHRRQPCSLRNLDARGADLLDAILSSTPITSSGWRDSEQTLQQPERRPAGGSDGYGDTPRERMFAPAIGPGMSPNHCHRLRTRSAASTWRCARSAARRQRNAP
jgi:hypothetical protein